MIHRYSLKGKKFVLDINSGSVHILDDIAYEMVAFLDETMPAQCPQHIFDKMSNYNKDEILETYAEIYKLFETGYLFSDDDYVDINAAIPTGAPVKALCLHVSHDCNLRCGYCFAGTGDFGTGRMHMDLDVAKSAIDFVILRSVGRRNLEVDFFGGEPLMNFEVVKKTVEYARSIEKKHGKNIRFTITTNGVLLDDEKIKYINENMSNVVLSIDGSQNTNDNMRKTIDGRGSYDVIMPKFQKLIDGRDKDYYARGTFTSKNLNFSEDVLHIAEAGFKHLSVEPVTKEDGSGFEITKADLPKIYAEYEKLCDIILKKRTEDKSFNFFHFLIDLDQGPCVIKRLRGCGAGYEYVAVTPEGDIYPCHQFVGREEYKIGSVHDKSFNMQMSDEFSSMNVYSRNKCKDCWAKFYCSGGCSASNKVVNDDVMEPYEIGCLLEKKRLECAIYLKACE